MTALEIIEKAYKALDPEREFRESVILMLAAGLPALLDEEEITQPMQLGG